VALTQGGLALSGLVELPNSGTFRGGGATDWAASLASNRVLAAVFWRSVLGSFVSRPLVFGPGLVGETILLVGDNPDVARLQSRQFPAHAGDAQADQGLVAINRTRGRALTGPSAAVW
jgi:hypothetical protein